VDYNSLLRGDELFEFDGMPQPVNVSDFWAWAMSRLIADDPRGDLAEFIVRVALSEDIKTPKHGWGECDIDYRDKRVEVKCSSVLQAWHREKDSTPRFGIAPTTNCMIKQDDAGKWYYHGPDGSGCYRRSDVYVFCLFANSDRDSADLLKLEQWIFWVLPTSVLDKQVEGQKHITIPSMEKLGAVKTDYHGLRSVVDCEIDKLENDIFW
jgi:hypothetical protein